MKTKSLASLPRIRLELVKFVNIKLRTVTVIQPAENPFIGNLEVPEGLPRSLVGVPLRGDPPACDGGRLGFRLGVIISEEPVASAALLATHTIAADVDATLLGGRRLGEFPVRVQALQNLLLRLRQRAAVGVFIACLGIMGRLGAVISDIERTAEHLGALLVVDVLANIVEWAILAGLFVLVEDRILVETRTLAVLGAFAANVLDPLCCRSSFVIKIEVGFCILARLVNDRTLDRRFFGVL